MSDTEILNGLDSFLSTVINDQYIRIAMWKNASGQIHIVLPKGLRVKTYSDIREALANIEDILTELS